MTDAIDGVSITHDGTRSQIAVVTLDRPDRANAVDPVMARRLHAAIANVLADPDVDVLILTGAGDTFSPGADATAALEQARLASEGRYPAEPFDGLVSAMQAATLEIHNASKPTIAAINGSAAAGALDLALACDFRIAAPAARFSESYVRLALPPLNAGAWLLTRAVGEARALRLLLTGETVDANMALEIGIIHELIDVGPVLDRALELAESLSRAVAPVAAFVKREVRDARMSDLADAQSRALVAGIAALNSAGYQDAINLALARYRR
jgi:enoyl-CoA hydratase/carnithine racemase